MKGVEMTTQTWEQQTERSWRGFAERLEQWLAAVPADGRVVIELEWAPEVCAASDEAGAAPYVQFEIDGGELRAEAASNHHLERRFRLDTGRVADLYILGWDEPAGDGNFTLTGELPGEAQEFAARLVVTLRDVYGVPDPSFLVMSGFDEDGAWDAEQLPLGLRIAEPVPAEVDVTAVPAGDADALRDLVADAMRELLGDDVAFDADGDIPVRAGRTTVYVGVVEDVPVVRMLAPLLSDVRWRPRVGSELNAVNRGAVFYRVVFIDGQVYAEHEMFCQPFVPELFRCAVKGMRAVVDELAIRLQQHIGGQLCGEHPDGTA